MIRRLEFQSRWRSFDENTWPRDLSLRKWTVVYGHNGSGKSTLAEAFLKLRSPDSKDEECNCEAEMSCRAETLESKNISVFTRKWVNDNLSSFLDGGSAEGIVTLGKAAKASKRREMQLRRDLKEQKEHLGEQQAEQKKNEEALTSLLRGVQDEIVGTLGITRGQYNINKVTTAMDEISSKLSPERIKNLKSLIDSPEPKRIEIAVPFEFDFIDLKSLFALLEQSPKQETIKELKENSAFQSWVEEGLSLHAGLTHCIFCTCELPEDRLDRLAKHYNESWKKVKRNAESLKIEIENKFENFQNWYKKLPQSDSLSPDLRDKYTEARRKLDFERYRVFFEEVIKILESKIHNPGKTEFKLPDFEIFNSNCVRRIVDIINEHNQSVDNDADSVDKARFAIVKHYCALRREEYTTLRKDLRKNENDIARTNKDIDNSQKQLKVEVAKRFSTATMAEKLTNDMRSVYGKGHLRVSVSDDGKSYYCTREAGTPAEHLSEGEQKALALSYFIRSLEEERVDTTTKNADRVIVIDDPSSSMDQESIYGMHGFLRQRLQNFGQVVILTHDFSLFRLLMQSVKRSPKNEGSEPRGVFFEMHTVGEKQGRASRLTKIPEKVLKRKSEYNYLFYKVARSILDFNVGTDVYLLPNAMRRIWEVYCNFKVPQIEGFRAQLTELTRVYDPDKAIGAQDDTIRAFLNQYSHGETSVMDYHTDPYALRREIIQQMKILYSIDKPHVISMLRAIYDDDKEVDEMEVILQG